MLIFTVAPARSFSTKAAKFVKKRSFAEKKHAQYTHIAGESQEFLPEGIGPFWIPA